MTVADPATGTGTFLLSVLRRIAESTEADQGPGAVPGAVEAALSHLIGFEIQFGPFAVAQLRILAELQSLLDDSKATPTRVYSSPCASSWRWASADGSRAVPRVARSRRPSAVGCRIFWNPGPLRKPATVMKETMPFLSRSRPSILLHAVDGRGGADD